ncbi:tetratricopeptide repeat protein [Capilliphycus salinus ALCB114379]|uniref:tetratricopeptide repeat protein n=1 Tax=Capilliphycus salinus TaxID=2768948 RepID=UPI0039A6B6AD
MKEIEQVAAALENQDYKTAAKLLKQLQKQSPENPWVLFYIGRWYEGTDKLQSAEKIYRKLLRNATNPKVIDLARKGLQRLETLEQNRRQAAINQAKTDPRNSETGVLILEPILPEHKQTAAQHLAKLLNTDPYTARMQLQSRGWRLYRTGEMAELQVYGQEMQNAGIPVFWVSLSDIERIHVFRVLYFQSISPQPVVVCQNQNNQLGSLSFDWSEVTQRVEGLLPLFMEAMDYDPRRRRTDRFRHKEMTQDYAQVYDLHLGDRQSILRFCDQTYDFQQGISFNPTTSNPSAKGAYPAENTTRLNWNRLLERFNHSLANIPLWSDFTPFAETAIDYTQLLSRLNSHLDIDRKSETPWDPAFHLYSGLVFLKVQQK